MAFQETIVLDAQCECNRNPWFAPLQRPLIGELRSSELKTDRPNGLLVQLQSVPGERLIVDFKARICKVVHRLDLPENKELARKVRASVYSQAGNYQKFGRFSEQENEEHAFREDEVATWLYNLRLLVDHDRLHVVSGKLPTMDQIKDMGERIYIGESMGAKVDKDNNYGIKSLNWLEPKQKEPALAGK